MNNRKSLQLSTCAFCNSGGELRMSHIIPRFVWDWFKKTSATGYIRSGEAPDMRRQDGHKERLLCHDCEQLFSQWEKSVAEQVFLPIHDGEYLPAQPVVYGEWMAKFAASVCWRVLFWYKQLGLTHLDDLQRFMADRALDGWCKYLNGEANTIGVHELHCVAVGPLGHDSTQLGPANLNRYLLRSVDVDIVRGSESAFVYVKMCRILIFGFIDMPNANFWQGSRLSLKDGTLVNPKIHLPKSIGDFINDRAENAHLRAMQISKAQRAKLDKWMKENPDKVAASESFRAMVHDVEMFGSDAFAPNDAN